MASSQRKPRLAERPGWARTGTPPASVIQRAASPGDRGRKGTWPGQPSPMRRAKASWRLPAAPRCTRALAKWTRDRRRVGAMLATSSRVMGMLRARSRSIMRWFRSSRRAGASRRCGCWRPASQGSRNSPRTWSSRSRNWQLSSRPGIRRVWTSGWMARKRGRPLRVSWSVRARAVRPASSASIAKASGASVPSEKREWQWRSITIGSAGTEGLGRGARDAHGGLAGSPGRGLRA